jgi:hypothetical protein
MKPGHRPCRSSTFRDRRGTATFTCETSIVEHPFEGRSMKECGS